MTKEDRRIPCYVDMDTSKLDEFLLKQNKKIRELKEKLHKVSQAHEREHLKVVYRAEEKGEAAMEESTEKYKFKLYTFKKKSRTKVADRKAVKRRAEFKKIVNADFELLYECMLKAFMDTEVK